MPKRQLRKGEVNCYCSAYQFPHRFGGGKCKGFNLVQSQWLTYFGSGDCENCNLRCEDENTCNVFDGIEKTKECPVVQEFIQQNDVRLLGKYWK